LRSLELSGTGLDRSDDEGGSRRGGKDRDLNDAVAELIRLKDSPPRSSTVADRRRQMTDITFHSMEDSAYLWTAMHVADEKGVSYMFAPLVYRSPEHLKLQPFGKMPVLQHGTNFLYETAAIAHYIDKAFDGPPLQPSDALAQAHMLRWISIVNAYVFPIMNRFMKERLVRKAWGFEPDEAFMASAQEPLALQVRLIDEAVTKTAYLVGDGLTIADSFLLPHLLFFGITPEGKALLAKATGASAWLARMCERQSFAVSRMRRVFDAMSQIKLDARKKMESAL
jgi:glutathione S-transferase